MMWRVAPGSSGGITCRVHRARQTVVAVKIVLDGVAFITINSQLPLAH
jgi:hypothetical protein